MLRFLNFFVPIITMPKNNRNEKNTISNKNLHDNCKFAGTVDCSKSCKDNNKLASGNHKKTCCNNQKDCDQILGIARKIAKSNHGLFLKLDNRKVIAWYIALIIILAVTHASVFIFIISLFSIASKSLTSLSVFRHLEHSFSMLFILFCGL